MERLDVVLMTRNLAVSRERAQAAIAAGLVLVDGKVARKASQKVDPSQELVVTGDPIGYVSRGGLKLEAALDAFAVEASGKVVLDVGASTGGFTHCLLDRGARRVFAVDVGRDQLAAELRIDPRVVNLEGTDIRAVTRDILGDTPDLATIDVSFISLHKVLPAVLGLVALEGTIVCLVKPQFEVGPKGIGKGGIVRDVKLQRQAVTGVQALARELGWRPSEALPSPIKGTEGNQEYLLRLDRVK